LTVAGDDLDWLAVRIVRLGFEVDVVEPPELREAAARLARDLSAIAEPGRAAGRSAPVQ
jgi:hypothetical protein